jgi:hypothetical protein
VNYYGEVSKTMPGNILYTVIYEGTPIEVSESPALPIEAPAVNMAILLVIVLGVGLLIGGYFALPYIKQILRKVRTRNEAIIETKRNIKQD